MEPKLIATHTEYNPEWEFWAIYLESQDRKEKYYLSGFQSYDFADGYMTAWNIAGGGTFSSLIDHAYQQLKIQVRQHL
jgi:hypothetical protein